jgi:hypothetical protein
VLNIQKHNTLFGFSRLDEDSSREIGPRYSHTTYTTNRMPPFWERMEPEKGTDSIS